MRLLGVTVQGIKRFRQRSFVRVSSKLSALVGPNEVGKTTLLKAISLIDLSNPFPANLRSRGYDGDVFVEALLELDSTERDALGLPAAQKARVVDRTFAVLGGGTSREWAYVTMSRGRESNRAYLLSCDTDEQCAHLSHQGRGDPLETAISSLERRERRDAAVKLSIGL